ncbi:MAG: hypothetical protein LUF35_06355 [Lachnospiraceae bacterium]|nr:hypothetical protein [Lachnospiraceae bacterium]
MGYYLNSADAFELYERETKKPYFVDKTELLKELFPLVEQGGYEELKDYVLNDIDGVREAVMLLVAGEPIQADISEYATTAQKLEKRDEILSVMTVYGYLNYYDGYVRIPNRELQTEFDKIVKTEPRFNYMRELERESKRILQATYDGDVDTIANVLEFVHNSESPLKSYISEWYVNTICHSQKI